MDEKRSTIFTIILIASVILVFSAADLIYGDRLYSELENKVLASRPEFSWNALLEGDFTRDYETYLTDQFAGREKWISIKTYMDICLGKQEINGVYLGADDYLIEQHLPKQFSSVQENKKLSLLEKLVSEWNASVMLVPTADNVIMDKLPPFAVCYDQVRFLEQKFSQGNPGFLSPRERGNRLCKLMFGKSQTFQHTGDFTLVHIAAPALKSVGEIIILPHEGFQRRPLGPVHFQFTVPDAMLQIRQVLFHGQKFLINCICGVHRAVLGKIAQRFVFCQRDDTFIRRYFPHQNAQQRGLAGTVDAHNGSFFIILQMEGDM